LFISQIKKYKFAFEVHARQDQQGQFKTYVKDSVKVVVIMVIMNYGNIFMVVVMVFEI
jgi:hypothetical protein